MKKLVLIVALGSFGWGSAFAGNTGGSSSSGSTVLPQGTAVSQQGQQQQQQATAGANNAGNSQNVTFTTPADTSSTVTQNVTSNGTQTVNEVVSGGTQNGISESVHETIKNVPNVNAPALVSSNDTCMGSTSAGVGIVGTGVSFGTTWTDKNCTMLKNSRELWNMGMRGAAMARMCMDKLNREALEMTGFVCPQSEQKKK